MKIELIGDKAPPEGHDGVDAMDELRATKANVHFERMDGNHVVGEIETKSGSVRVVFWTRGANLYFGAERDD